MNLERASERADSVRGTKSAARLYNDIEYELALGEPDDHLENAGEHALAVLEGRFPGVREAAREIEHPPSLSRRAGDALHEAGRTPSPHLPACRSKHQVHRRIWPSRSRLFASARAHPLATVATVIVCTIVIVHIWAYIALALIALVAVRASRARQN
jgi:hypothetical protein